MFIHDIGLNIFSDPPRVKLNLGSGIDRNQISEGQDVYMDCEIRANPRFYKVEWIHNVSSISNIHEIENMSLFKYLIIPIDNPTKSCRLQLNKYLWTSVQ